MNLQIITDSACDLPDEVIKQYQIETAPFIINLRGQEFLDGVTIKPPELVDKIEKGEIPSTTQIPAEHFYRIFEKYASQGIHCLYIGFSSKMSGTFQTASMVAKDLEDKYQNIKIHTIDSLSGSMAQGLIVKEIARHVESGASIDFVLDKIQNLKARIEHIFTINDLKFLYRGGRIKLSSAWLGSLLNIKPILKVNHGEIIPFEKQRGTKKVLRRMVHMFMDAKTDLTSVIIGITHAGDPEKADKIKKMIQEETDVKNENFMINHIGCVLCAHLGIGGVGIFFFQDS